MKEMMKKFSMMFAVLVLALGLTACSSEETIEKAEVKGMTEESANSLTKEYLTLIETWAGLSDLEVDTYISYYGFDEEVIDQAIMVWQENEDELGAYQSVLSATVSADGDKYTITSEVAFEEKDATVTMTFDLVDGYFSPAYMAIEIQYTLGEMMGQAAMNTLMGVGVVFLVLLFLCFLIGAFKYIGVFADKFTKKAASATKEDAVVAAQPEKNLVDDGELVAVIAAAIAASEHTSTDSFVVRSIRRKPNNKWSRA